MASLNKVVLIGNLTRDVELRYLPAGTAVGEFGLAMNRQWTTESGEKKEEVTFVDVTVWGKSAENAAQYSSKGLSICVEGRLSLDQWDDKQTGQKRSKLKVVAERVVFLAFKKDGDHDERPARSQSAARQPSTRQQSPAPQNQESPEYCVDMPF